MPPASCSASFINHTFQARPGVSAIGLATPSQAPARSARGMLNFRFTCRICCGICPSCPGKRNPAAKRVIRGGSTRNNCYSGRVDEPSAPALTRLLLAWSRGDVGARDQLFPLVYAELRRRAAGYLRREARGHTLQPTALVHEAYLRLSDKNPGWKSRTHFFAVA